MIHLKDYLSSISNYVSVAGSNRNRFDHQTAKADSLPPLPCPWCEMQFLHMSCTASGATIRTFKVIQKKLATHSSSQLLKHQELPRQHQLSCQTNCTRQQTSGHISNVLQTEARLTSCSLYLQVTVSQQCYKRHGLGRKPVCQGVLPLYSHQSFLHFPAMCLYLTICKTDPHGNPSLLLCGDAHSLFSPLISLHLYLRC